MIEIKTERLVLCDLRETDAPALAKAANNYEVVRWLSLLPYPYTIEDAKWFISSIKERPNQAYGVFYEDQLVGVISIEGMQELGYWFAQEAWGKGFATEAAIALVNAHFAKPDACDLLSGYITENMGSARVQEKLGFEITGRKSVKRKYFGETELVQTVLTRERWLSL